jgi:hypothetical protein
MGQPVSVIQQPSSTPGRVRFELNRSLTGQGHERYTAAVASRTGKPSDVLANRLFATGDVSAVHVFGNMITVDVKTGSGNDSLIKVIEDLYQYWTPGKLPPSEEELMAQAPKSEVATAAPSADGSPSAGVVDSRIPAALLARSQAALAKARAKQG